MLSTVVAGRGIMIRQNQAWGIAIKALLDRHQLSLRGAEIRTGGSVTRSYISEWVSGKVPQYETAIAFLEHFPRDEAIECLTAAGFPVPEDWRENPSDAVEAVEFCLRSVTNLPDHAKQQIIDFVREQQQKYGATPE